MNPPHRAIYGSRTALRFHALSRLVEGNTLADRIALGPF